MGKPLGGRAETRTLLDSLQRSPNPLPSGEGLVGPFPRIVSPLRPFGPQAAALLVLLTPPQLSSAFIYPTTPLASQP